MDATPNGKILALKPADRMMEMSVALNRLSELLAIFSSAMQAFWTRVDERRFPWAYAAAGARRSRAFGLDR